MYGLTLGMSDVIRLLNGKTIIRCTSTFEGQAQRVELSLFREDTSVSCKGAVERIEGEWDFTLKEEGKDEH